MSLSSQVFDAKQLAGEIVDRSYFTQAELQVYVQNLIRIVAEQSARIRELESKIHRLEIKTYGAPVP